MVEPEIAFADLNDDMDLMEAMIKYIIKDVMACCPQDIDFFNQFVDKGLQRASGACGKLRFRPHFLYGCRKAP